MTKSNNKNTAWDSAAEWYDNYLETEADNYQRQVIWPNLWRLLEVKPGARVLDLACGSGFFSRQLAEAGAAVTGVDLSGELIALAKKRSAEAKLKIDYHIASAEKLEMLKPNYFDRVIIVLALQNLEKVKETFAAVKKVLRPEGKLLLVLNHPAFRIPKKSSWGWDEENKIQYRRLDGYLSEAKVKIITHPGQSRIEGTTSFHRPLQYYFKALVVTGLAVTRLEEWNSHKTSAAGPRAAAENHARQEFPLFLCLEAKML